MQSGRNFLWFVIVGAVAAVGIYYFFEGEGKPPPKPPAAVETPAPEGPSPVPEAASPEAAAPEATPADAAAADAEKTVKQIEEDEKRQQDMMEAPNMSEEMPEDPAPQD